MDPHVFHTCSAIMVSNPDCTISPSSIYPPQDLTRYINLHLPVLDEQGCLRNTGFSWSVSDTPPSHDGSWVVLVHPLVQQHITIMDRSWLMKWHVIMPTLRGQFNIDTGLVGHQFQHWVTMLPCCLMR